MMKRKRRGAVFHSFETWSLTAQPPCAVRVIVGSRSAKLWTTTAKMGMTQMLWSYNALYYAHRRFLFISFHLSSSSNASSPSAFLPVIHQDHTPRQHPGPVHLLHNILLRCCFIVRLSFLLANHHFRFTVPGAYQFFHTRIFDILATPPEI